MHLGGGVWLTLRAARVDAADPPADQDIAVTIELTPPVERRTLFARAHALTGRETELLELLAHGADTRTLAQQLFVSEHTVQEGSPEVDLRQDRCSEPPYPADPLGRPLTAGIP